MSVRVELIDFKLTGNHHDHDHQTMLSNEFRIKMREPLKRSLSCNFQKIDELSLPKDPLDLVISHKYSLIIVSCMGGSHSRESVLDDCIMAFDLHSRKLVAILENNIKTLCLCLEENYDGHQGEALMYSKGSHLSKYDLGSIVENLGSNQTKSDVHEVIDAIVMTNSNDSEEEEEEEQGNVSPTIVSGAVPIWTSLREKNSFGMCIDYGMCSSIRKSTRKSIEERRLFICEDENIVISWAHTGQVICCIDRLDAWGIRINSCGDLIYSMFYRAELELIKRIEIEKPDPRVCVTYSVDSESVSSVYASGISIDPNNGNIIAILHSIIVIFSPDGRELSRRPIRNAQGCCLDEYSGSLFVAINGSQSIAIFK